ncbi:MAG: DNA metabolism protein [Spirochaetales bacterium]|nr:MAG: DNA metabolism protein [Spirochaetales bacterium]
MHQINQPGRHADSVPPRFLEHDGSFPCFLCATAEALNEVIAGRPSPVVSGPAIAEELFEQRETVARDDRRAATLWTRLERRAGNEAIRTLLEAFCSDLPGANEAVATAIARIWVEGACVLNDLGSPEILAVEKAAVRTRAEAHLMTGLVRFSGLSDDSWYSSIQPDCDILVLIADHFASRFPGMNWIIHDRGRHTAIIHRPEAGWKVVEGFALEGKLAWSDDESRLRETWSRYFRSVAIGERTNPRLQVSHMPKKYWGDLPETRLKG